MSDAPEGMPTLNQGLTAAAVTPSNTTEIGPTRALYVGTNGDVAVVMWEDNDEVTITFVNVPNATFLPLNVRRVMAATTALNIIAIY